MLARYEYAGIVWVDLQSPTQAEVRNVADEFGIAPQIAEELLIEASKPRADFFENYCFVVMHFPALKHTHIAREQEVDFIIGRNFLITTHYDTIDPLHKFSKVFEVNATLNTEPLGEHAGFLFFFALRKLYRSVDHELEFMRHDLAVIEERIFSGSEVEMVTAISRAARALLNLRQTIEPHRDVLRALEEHGGEFFGHDFVPFLRTLSNEYYRVHNHITRATDTLHELRETNNSLLTTKQNETMRVLTLLALFILPLSFLAELFAMSTHSTPLIGRSGDFWMVLGLMGSFVLLMYLFFKHKKWL